MGCGVLRQKRVVGCSRFLRSSLPIPILLPLCSCSSLRALVSPFHRNRVVGSRHQRTQNILRPRPPFSQVLELSRPNAHSLLGFRRTSGMQRYCRCWDVAPPRTRSRKREYSALLPRCNRIAGERWLLASASVVLNLALLLRLRELRSRSADGDQWSMRACRMLLDRRCRAQLHGFYHTFAGPFPGFHRVEWLSIRFVRFPSILFVFPTVQCMFVVVSVG